MTSLPIEAEPETQAEYATPAERLPLRDLADSTDRAMLWLAAGFLLLSPLSMATDLPLHEPAKYLRLLATLGIVALGMSRPALHPFGPATRSLLIFMVVFWLAALWSDLPHWGLFHKGQAFLAVFAGALLARSFNSIEQAHASLRLLALILGLSAAGLFYASGFGGATGSTATAVAAERLDTFGMNPNLIGNTAASYLLIVAFVALHEPRGLMRTVFWGLAAVIGCLVLASGSRGAVLLAAVGVTVTMFPAVRSPARLVGAMLLGLLFAYAVVAILGLGGSERVWEEMGKDTRSGIWTSGWRRFSSSPLIGVGWLHSGTGWATLQSAYLQVAVEAGLIGLACLAVALARTLTATVAVIRDTARSHAHAGTGVMFLGAGLSSAMVLSGSFENSILVGTAANAFLFGFGVTLLDHIGDPADPAEAVDVDR